MESGVWKGGEGFVQLIYRVPCICLVGSSLIHWMVSIRLAQSHGRLVG